MEKQFYSQVGQDKWVCEYFKYKKEGFFIDIGAHDGIDLSNTYYLEKELGWQGICIEAWIDKFNDLKNNRSTVCLNNAVYSKDQLVTFKSDGDMGGKISNDGILTVDGLTLKTILKQQNAPKVIDYISLDIEGAEVDALIGFPFKEYEVVLWTIEHNLHVGAAERLAKGNIKNIMTKNGYTIIKENVGTSALYPMEDWYINKKYL